MKIVMDDNYGVDIDGNRGISVIDDIELDEDDYGAIQDEIEKNYCGEEYNDNILISLPVDGHNIDFKLIISDYFTEGEFEMLQGS